MKLHNYLNPALAIQISKNSITFKEADNKENELQAITIRDLPDNTFVFSLDQHIDYSFGNSQKARNYYFNEQHNRINKCCDGIILLYRQNYVDIIFCELKSQSPKALQYETQLINAKHFIDYLICLFNEFQTKKEVTDTIEPPISVGNIIFVLFYLDRAIKQPKSKFVRTAPDYQVSTQLPKEKMKHYDQEIVKCAFDKEQYNDIEFKRLLQ